MEVSPEQEAVQHGADLQKLREAEVEFSGPPEGAWQGAWTHTRERGLGHTLNL